MHDKKRMQGRTSQKMAQPVEASCSCKDMIRERYDMWKTKRSGINSETIWDDKIMQARSTIRIVGNHLG